MAWTLRTLVSAAGIDGEVRGDAPVAGLAYRSEDVAGADAFCCIPGESADGHDFAGAAAGAGALSLVVERFLDIDVAQCKVDCVRRVLGPLAHTFFGRPSEQIDVLAVTGTNGKTTVAHLLESIAAAAGRTPGMIGTVYRRFGGVVEDAPRNTPEAIDLHRLLRRMADAGVDVVAIEATSDGLARDRLRSTHVACAGFTNLTQDHLNTHGTMDAYFEAKASLFDRSYTSRATINAADPYGRTLIDRVRGAVDVLSYGSDDADVAAESADMTPGGTRARVRTPSITFDISTPLVGRYNLSNCLCAVGMALHARFDPADIAAGIASLESVPGRLERISCGQPFLALVDYAHTPDALTNALLACRELTDGRVIVVFGCGGDRDRAKRPLMGEAAARLADLAIITSDNPRSEDPAAIVAEIGAGAASTGRAYRTILDRREAIGVAVGEAHVGDVVLVAGKGHEQGQTFADRVVPFDDRVVVGELLEAVACRG